MLPKELYKICTQKLNVNNWTMLKNCTIGAGWLPLARWYKKHENTNHTKTYTQSPWKWFSLQRMMMMMTMKIIMMMMMTVNIMMMAMTTKIFMIWRSRRHLSKNWARKSFTSSGTHIFCHFSAFIMVLIMVMDMYDDPGYDHNGYDHNGIWGTHIFFHFSAFLKNETNSLYKFLCLWVCTRNILPLIWDSWAYNLEWSKSWMGNCDVLKLMKKPTLDLTLHQYQPFSGRFLFSCTEMSLNW